MKKNIKRLVAVLVVMAMIISMCSTAFAAGRGSNKPSRGHHKGWTTEASVEQTEAPVVEDTTETPTEDQATVETAEPAPDEAAVEEAEDTAVTEDTESDEAAATSDAEATVTEEDTDASAEETEVAYPAVEFDSVDDVEGITVHVDAPEGALPEGTTMKVSEVKLDAVQGAVDKADDITGTVVAAVDITFFDANSVEVEPNTDITVTMTSDKIAETTDPKVVHVDVKADEIEDADVAADKVNDDKVTADDDAVTFDADQFSVYAVVDGSGNLVQPRVTYHFLDELKENGTADPYVFVNKAGESVDYQIVKENDGVWESLEDPGSPAVSLEKNFLGWFVVTKNEDGTYTFPADASAIDFTQAPPVTTTVTEGDKDVYVAPRFGQAFIVTFWDNAKGSPADQMHIVAKRVVYLDEGKDYASVRVDNVTVPSAATQVLSGWTSDDYVTGSQTTYTLLEKPSWDQVTQSFNLYPVFSDGHWLRFAGGPSGSGAGYRQAIFVTANTQASELAALGTVAREGYNFNGWYYAGSNDNPFDGTEAATNASGAALNAADLLSRVQNADGDTTLYGHWTGKQVTYRVATWFENADDDGYSFGEVTPSYGTAGTTTNVTASAVSGFTAQTISQQEIKGDGTTIVNVYYKRDVYTIRFYNKRGNNEYSDLKITAKYGADIHDQWPGTKEGTENYSSAWDISTGNNSRYVVTISTMPLGGTNFYQHSDGSYPYQIKRYVQNVTGGNAFSEYNRSPFGGNRNDAIGAEDFMHIDGFRVNANSTANAASIRSDTTGDPDAVCESSYSRSDAINSSFANAVWENNRRTLKIYYLRNQYEVSFNTQKSAAVAPASLTGIYYEANIASVKATQIAALNEQYKIGETKVEVTGEGTYVFQGWYDNAACLGDPFDFNQKMPAGNITLYAKWERVYYLIQIDPKGGEILPNVNEVTYTWLQYGDKVEQYNIRRDYVEATTDYTGDRYYYVNVLASDDEHARDSEGYYWSGYRKGFYIKTTEINNAEYSWWKENGYIDTTTEYMPATANDNYAFVGWYNAANDQVYDFDSIVTGETSIYAKWRRSGLFNIQYHTQNGTVSSLIGTSLVATDSSYADQAETKIAYTPTHVTSTDGKAYVFVGWKVADPATFDVNNPGDATLGDTLYKQGDDFTVDASKADSSHYIHMVAVYELAENNPDTLPVTTITFDPNFPTDATETTGKTKKIDGVPLNTKIDLDKDSFTIELPNVANREETIPKFTATGYIQTGWNTMPDGTGTAFGMTDVVGVDNLDKEKNTKANTLYAVWEKAYFFVYHSATGKLEAISLADVKDDGTYDLTQKVSAGHLYGGWYDACGGATVENVKATFNVAISAEDKQADVPEAVKYDGKSLKNGTVRFWTKSDITGNTIGTAVKPKDNDVFYLKEVPECYLQTNAKWVYDWSEDNAIKNIYMITGVDDTFYNQIGFTIIADTNVAKLYSNFSYQQRNSTTVTKITANDIIGQRGYLGIVDASTYINSIDDKGIKLIPYWITLDGVRVTTAGYTFTKEGEGTLTTDNLKTTKN